MWVILDVVHYTKTTKSGYRTFLSRGKSDDLSHGRETLLNLKNTFRTLVVHVEDRQPEKNLGSLR